MERQPVRCGARSVHAAFAHVAGCQLLSEGKFVGILRKTGISYFVCPAAEKRESVSLEISTMVDNQEDFDDPVGTNDFRFKPGSGAYCCMVSIQQMSSFSCTRFVCITVE